MSNIEIRKNDLFRNVLGVNDIKQFPENVNMQSVQPTIEVSQQGFYDDNPYSNRLYMSGNHTLVTVAELTYVMPVFQYISVTGGFSGNLSYPQNNLCRVMSAEIDLTFDSADVNWLNWVNNSTSYTMALVAYVLDHPSFGLTHIHAVDVTHHKIQWSDISMLGQRAFMIASVAKNLVLMPGEELWVGIVPENHFPAFPVTGNKPALEVKAKAFFKPIGTAPLSHW